MTDELLDCLGDAFVASGLAEQGWTFELFIEMYNRGYIEVK